MKFAKILICTILMVAILAVPCYAADTIIESGVYYGTSSILISDLSSDPVDLPFFYIKEGVRYDCVGISFYFREGIERIGYYDLSDGTQLRVYDHGWLDSAYQTIYVENDYRYEPTSRQMAFYSIFSSVFTKISTIDSDQPLITDIFAVFGFVGNWISGASSDLALMFWDPTEGSLTFVGLLAIAALAFSVCFLLVGFISKFIRFKS